MTEYEMANTLVPSKEMSLNRLCEIAKEWKEIYNTHLELYPTEITDDILLKKYEEAIEKSWNMYWDTIKIIEEKSKE